MEEVRKVFYLKLQTLAVQIGEQYTDEGFDGDPSIEVKYAGHLVGNYPWLYLDYTVKGPLDLVSLSKMDLAFRKLCEDQPGASYLNTVINGSRLRFRLIFREDIAHFEGKKKGPPEAPGGPQNGESTTP